jgi:hypothetical protein
MGLVETLVIGSYLYTTAFGGWLFRQVSKLQSNHLQHLEDRVLSLEQAETQRTQAETDSGARDQSGQWPQR